MPRARIVIFLALASASCKSHTATTSDAVASVQVTLTQNTVIPGGTVQASAVLRDADGDEVTAAVAWSSGNPSVASVSASGLVTAVSAGSTTIQATSEGDHGTATLTVQASPVASVVVTLTNSTLAPGATTQASALLHDQPGNVLTGRTVTWTSLTLSVATVSASGLVTAVSAGAAAIQATSEGITGSATVTVTPAPVATVTTSASPSSIAVGGTSQASAVVKDAHGNTLTARAIAWSSLSPSVATVSSSGLVTGVSAGTAVIRASSEGVNGDATITVIAGSDLISAGGVHSCGIAHAVTYCWGEGDLLGDSSSTQSSTPRAVAGGLTFKTVAASIDDDLDDGVSCALTSAGTPWCWGENAHGQLGNGTTTTALAPVAVAGALAFSSLSTGDGYTCGLTPTGAAWCWGRNERGQLGDSNQTGIQATPVMVKTSLVFTEVSAGLDYSCGLVAGGDVYCWGQAGDIPTPTLTPTRIPGPPALHGITAGKSYGCGLAASGVAWCWGANGFGELGNGSSTSSDSAVQVNGAHSFVTIDAGSRGTCAIAFGGGAWCWGENNFGAIGDGTTTQRLIPTAVSGSLTFLTVSTSSAATCGMTTSLDWYCWGDNTAGQVGDGTQTNRTVPARVLKP